MPRPSSPSRKPLRRNVTLPGILRETIEQRWAEFGYPSFAPFALELICFDLRKRRAHFLTREFADDTSSAQEAIDRELVRQYVPGKERRGILMQALRNVAETGRAQPRGSYASFRNMVLCSDILDPCIETRWRELGYKSFSAYVTALIRYDLMLLGPHKYFNGNDSDPRVLAALDAETARQFHENKPQPLFLDLLIEEAAGRKMSDEELAGSMRRIAAELKERATRRG